MLCEAYSYDALSQTTTYKYFIRFKSGRTSMDDDKQSVRPSTSRSKPLVAQVKNIIHGNRRLTVQEVVEKVGISIRSCHTILTKDSGMNQASAKFLLRLLTDDLILHQFSICENLRKSHYRR
jgi:hypothetical protein